MIALLDTNVVIHRELHTVLNKDIGSLLDWLRKCSYIPSIHQITIDEIRKNSNMKNVETYLAKLKSYNLLNTVAPLSIENHNIFKRLDNNENDLNDSLLLNQVYCNRVQIFITEDKKIHQKAKLLGISDKVFTIDSFLEKVISENPSLIDYSVLSVRQEYFGNINVRDTFFDSFRLNYAEFDKWFTNKSEERCYVTKNNNSILSFLYIKVENEKENYSNISPIMLTKKRLKIGTFKVVENGFKLGERFLKIIFDNAILYKVDEIYLTIFDDSLDKNRLISLIMQWGFKKHGIKTTNNGIEIVWVRDFEPNVDINNPCFTYPYISNQTNKFICAIYPEYHTELLPDSYLRTESPDNFIENEPYRNAIKKVYITRAFRDIPRKGDIIFFYRTSDIHGQAKYRSVITTIAVVDEVQSNRNSFEELRKFCGNRALFSKTSLREFWDYRQDIRPFGIKFLYVYSVPRKMTLGELQEHRIIEPGSGPRGFMQITNDQFATIIRETNSDESIIIN